VPASLVGQGIHGPFAGDERGKGHEARHNRWEHLQLLLQPSEEAEAHLLTGRIKGSSPHTKLSVRVRELCMRPVDLCTRRGLRFVQAAAQAAVARFNLLSALASKIGLSTRKFGLGTCGLRLDIGLVRIPLFRCQPTAEVHFLGLHRRQPLHQPATLVFCS
jgi:hypothetical protein